MTFIVPRHAHAGELLAVLVSVVGAEEKRTAIGQRRTHVRLCTAAVATVEGRQLVDRFSFRLGSRRCHGILPRRVW